MTNDGDNDILKSSLEARGNNRYKQNPKTGKLEGSYQSDYVEISAAGVNKFKKGFSDENLRNHWYGNTEKKIHSHIDEYPGFTMKQYAQRALELIQAPVGNGVLGYESKDNKIVRYDTKTNDYVKGNPKTGIATMFKPKAGKRYFDGRKLKEE